MSSSTRPFDCVLFDLDGVLVDTAKLHYAAWKRLADTVAVHFDEQLNRGLKGVDRLGSLERLLGAGASRLSAVEKERLADLKNRWYVESLDTLAAGDLLPGAQQALAEVHRAGLGVALVSASRNARTVLARLGIADQFDVVVDPSAVTRGKPAPDIFLAAAHALDAAPAACLGVEDAAAGVAGLKAAGMSVVGVGDPVELHEADWVIGDMTCFSLSMFRSVA